jgi:hypothetical protein
VSRLRTGNAEPLDHLVALKHLAFRGRLLLPVLLRRDPLLKRNMIMARRKTEGARDSVQFVRGLETARELVKDQGKNALAALDSEIHEARQMAGMPSEAEELREQLAQAQERIKAFEALAEDEGLPRPQAPPVQRAPRRKRRTKAQIAADADAEAAAQESDEANGEAAE